MNFLECRKHKQNRKFGKNGHNTNCGTKLTEDDRASYNSNLELRVNDITWENFKQKKFTSI
jgi:transcription initiation factor IIE alpha subunit